MTKIIAIFNQAGGMGKTTLAKNLSYHLVQNSNKVLACDLDPQANLTKFLGQNPEELSSTIFDALVDETSPKIITDNFGIDLIPANTKLQAIDATLNDALDKDFRLQNMLKEIQSNYNYIILDCPPNAGVFGAKASLLAATHVLIPITTDEKGIDATGNVMRTVSQALKANKPLKVAGVVPNRFEGTKDDKEHLEIIKNSFEGKFPVFPTIPRATHFRAADTVNLPLAEYKSHYRNPDKNKNKLEPGQRAVLALKEIALALDNL